jgi:hypothetical protein
MTLVAAAANCYIQRNSGCILCSSHSEESPMIVVSQNILRSSAIRYKDGKRMLWINGIWFDDGKPWAEWKIEEKVYNAKGDPSLAAKGS